MSILKPRWGNIANIAETWQSYGKMHGPFRFKWHGVLAAGLRES